MNSPTANGFETGACNERVSRSKSRKIIICQKSARVWLNKPHRRQLNILNGLFWHSHVCDSPYLL